MEAFRRFRQLEIKKYNKHRNFSIVVLILAKKKDSMYAARLFDPQLTCKLEVKDSADKNFYRHVDIGIPSKNGNTREDQRDTGSDP